MIAVPATIGCDGAEQSRQKCGLADTLQDAEVSFKPDEQHQDKNADFAQRLDRFAPAH
jgi:hypothetical protein